LPGHAGGIVGAGDGISNGNRPLGSSPGGLIIWTIALNQSLTIIATTANAIIPSGVSQMNKIEISAGTANLAKIKNVADRGGKTSMFLDDLRRKNAFTRISDGGTYHGLEWDRVAAFTAHCEANGITVERRR
jgi:hypothetical protein